MSFFISFEGGEGSGKSSQARTLYHRLEKLAIPAVLTHEPGVTVLGQKMARLLKWAREVEISPVAELLMFNVSRVQLVSEVIRPGLKAGKVVICDRYADSTTAYQGYGRGLDPAMVREINAAGTGGLQPDLTVLLDMAPEAGLARKRGTADRFEQEEIAFHRRVREGYLALAKAEPQRWLVADAAKSKTVIAGIIWERVSRLLSRQAKESVPKRSAAFQK
ncbi:MAG: dTMP kinase [Chloroflexota bacterium]